MPCNLLIEEFRSLAALCTLGVGGPARYFTEVRNADEMAFAFRFAKENKRSVFLLGKGSNCLFDDRGYNGLVILNKIDFSRFEEPNEIIAGGGYSFSRLGSYTARNGWSGLEFASGIPGTVGGAVYMNAGANGHETATTLISVEFLSDEGERKIFSREELAFAYRSSPFHSMSGAILSARFRLQADPAAKRQQQEIVQYRTSTQPYGEASAGCFFVNPRNASAGSLIDSLGLKGLKVGGAQISPIHANFIVNQGNATAQEILELSALVKLRVKEAFGHELEQEVRYVPYVPS